MVSWMDDNQKDNNKKKLYVKFFFSCSCLMKTRKFICHDNFSKFSHFMSHLGSGKIEDFLELSTEFWEFWQHARGSVDYYEKPVSRSNVNKLKLSLKHFFLIWRELWIKNSNFSLNKKLHESSVWSLLISFIKA